ncbi:MAG: MBL fold metallo-hydrolase [Myxococcota bacterium]
MSWFPLGHATWLVEAAGLRLLFDPVLGPTHHAGVYEVHPPREIDAAALEADFLLISHRHTDHFDLPSLKALRKLDAASVVVSPDPLVLWAAEALGFETTHALPAGQHLRLDGVEIVTTPSVAPDEWGAMVACQGATAWNQIDSAMKSGAELRAVVQQGLEAIRAAHPALDLALVRWQPMLEVAAVLGEPTAFPFRSYAGLLSQLRELPAHTVCPTACGARRTARYGWLNRHAYPLTEGKFCADAAALGFEVLRPVLGAGYRVSPGTTSLDLGAGDRYVTAVGPREEHDYAPFETPPLSDPGLSARPVAVQRARNRGFVEGTLARSLLRAFPAMESARPLTFQVEVVYPDTTEAFAIRVSNDGVEVQREVADWDFLNQVSGSFLFEVVEGRWQWGDGLLGGLLRASSRGYAFDGSGIRRARVGKTFLYYGLPYDIAEERAIRSEVKRLVSAP